MKAEERKELEENSLAKGLGTLVERVKDGPSRNTIIVVALVGLVLILIGAWWFFSNRASKANAERWVQWHGVVDGEAMVEAKRQLPKDQQPPKGSSLPLTRHQYRLVQLNLLDKFSRDNEGTVQGNLARFQQARLAYEDGMTNLGNVIDHDRGLELIKKAEQLYSELADASEDYPILHQEALLNAALAKEILGNINESKQMLERLVREYPDGPAGERAKQALERQDKMSADLKQLVRDLAKPTNPAGS